ncbi:spindle pole body component 110-like [Trichogramma pretiosum]|uniref:spindle pole body component 110-like n=1 Tax=Trichogramma pretiosum TaxID=7493 RepID=UPI0006C95514|nr:spindle pole body component 110-like [Trichogramma pretiosum]
MSNEHVERELDRIRHNLKDDNSISNEYEIVVSSLKEDLINCKLEQSKLYVEVEALRQRNHNDGDSLQRSSADYNRQDNYLHSDDRSREMLMNLEKRITVLQMEKDSVYQLWQMALKSIDILEEELKSVHKMDKNAMFYQHHINSLKESYSEAINVLESKLIAGKENFFEQQAQWAKSKDEIDILSKEKNDIAQQLNTLQQQFIQKEKEYQSTESHLQNNLKQSCEQIEALQKSNTVLETKLQNAQQLINSLNSKDEAAQKKVSEAVELVEAITKEKEDILKREAMVVEEKNQLQILLSKLSEDYAVRLEHEIFKLKEMYHRNVKKYLLEIKELKSELKEKLILLDGLQRENQLMGSELEKVRRCSSDDHEKYGQKMSNSQRNDMFSNVKDTHNTQYDDRISYLENQISQLQDKLLNTTEKLRRVQFQNSRDVEDRVREADNRTREILEKCSNFERQLTRALMDKESLVSNIHELETSLEKEIQKRNGEKLILENKVRDMQNKITKVNPNEFFSKTLPNVHDVNHIGQQTSMNFDSISNILALQEKFEKKTKKLTQHVETHQKLSNKWKEEANLITSKFQKKTQELKNKISDLQKRNEDLSRELLFYQQLMARCNTHFIQNYEQNIESS